MALANKLRDQDRTRLGAHADLEPIYAVPSEPQAYQDLKADLHQKLIDKLDLSTIEKLSPDELRTALRSILATSMSTLSVPLNRTEREQLVQELLDEVTGLGPLEPLLRDGSVSDILVNTYNTVYVEHRGQLNLTAVRFRDNEHLRRIINRIVSAVGRRVDETQPMVDARLPDGSRVNAIIPPLAVDGPLLSIRRFGRTPLKAHELIAMESATEEMLGFLAASIVAKLNILISGGTGAGKTTLLNALSSFIPNNQRIVTIEDAAELQLQQRHVARLETRPANVEGKGEVLARDLVRNTLRMRPDRIIVGEVRGAEVLDMLQAMNTGHEGSMSTIHANAPRDALTRLEAMVGMAGVPMSEAGVRQMIARGLHLIVQLNRGVDGRRRITSVTEITGTEGSVVSIQELYRFEQQSVDTDGRVVGRFVCTNIRPRAMSRIESFGIDPLTVLQHRQSA